MGLGSAMESNRCMDNVNVLENGAAVNDELRDAVFERAGGRCECRRTLHLHLPRCPNSLTGDWAVFQPVPDSVPQAGSIYNLQGLCAECFESVSRLVAAHISRRRRAPRPRTVEDIYGG